MTFSISRIIVMPVLLLMFPFTSFALDATYYADSFEGGGTSDGSKFSQDIFSAAACSVGLGQYGYVSYGDTGVVVTVNDRPNCSRYPNIIDLSRTAFQKFAPTSAGRVQNVTLSVIGKNTDSFPKKVFMEDIFANLGVRLASPLANTYFTNDTILIQGRVLDKKAYALIYLEEKTTGKKITELTSTNSRGEFSYLLNLPNNGGEYYLIVASGNSFETKDPPLIKLIDKNTLTYPVISTGSLQILHPVISQGEIPSIKLPENIWAHLTIIRDGHEFISQGTDLSFRDINFTPGSAQVSIDGYMLSSPSSLDRSQYIPSIWSGAVILDRTHDSIGREKVAIRTTRQMATFRFRLKSSDRIRSTYYVTLPNGDVREYDFPKKYTDENGLLKTGVWISGNFGIKEQGSYKFEIVQEDGFAYVNIPLFQGNVWNILPPLTEAEISTLRSQLASVEQSSVSAINKIRVGLGRNLVSIDSSLSSLAQAKAEDMANDDYVGHYTKSGKNILDFAKSRNMKIIGSIGENVAGGNVSDIALQDGLEESGSHRYNMIDPLWTKVGIGYVLKSGKVYMVEVFGE